MGNEKQRILIVDDAKLNRHVALKYLKESPYHADTAENGQIAVDKFKQSSYSIIFMDMQMPLMDGLDATREIRKWEKEKNLERTPVIALTASELSEDIKKAQEAGCDFHITKPIQKEKLVEVIEKYARKTIEAAHEGKDKNLIVYVDPDFQDIVPEFLESLNAAIKDMQELCGKLQIKWDKENASALSQKAHKIAGSALTVGFEHVGKSARELEVLLKSILKETALATPEQKNHIALLVSNIEKGSKAAIVYEARHEEIEEEAQSVALKVQQTQPSAQSKKKDKEADANRLIFLIEDDTTLAKYLSQQLGYYGYTVRVFEKLFGVHGAILQTPPAAILSDIVFPEGELAGIQLISEVNKIHKDSIPVIFVSTRDDIVARLEAARAGCAAYFRKPVQVSDLIDKLDSLTARFVPERYRILVVDDDVATAEKHARILSDSGMLATCLSNPLQVMEPLIEFNPDLILMDVYMPECSGDELAAVIRQQEAFVSVPIVFLSVETNIGKQLTAMRFGADDFLTKPIEADHLVSSVSSRVERARVLRSFMKTDSLTGLLNHTAISEQLDIEISRAQRLNSMFSFAMIDMDHFKSVNDQYGHLAGDKVLKNLSWLLKMRLRRTDVLGRYGGEEFAAILLDSNADIAKKIVDEIRVSFNNVHHQSGVKTFTTSFSCGIASFERFRDATKLMVAADEALYEAKNKGRNQVIVAGER